jgi:hypothetical protein
MSNMTGTFKLLILSSTFILKLRIRYEIFRWRKILQKLELISGHNSVEKKKILIATNIGHNLSALAFDLVVGLALRSRGHSITFTLCNAAVSACMNCELNKFKNVDEFVNLGSSKFCTKCFLQGKSILELGGFQTRVINNRDNSVSRSWDAEVASSGAKRFLAVGKIQDTVEYEKVFEKFLKSSQRMNFEFDEILQEKKYDLVLAHHGIYVPQGNLVHVTKAMNVPILTWVQGYRRNTFIFGRGDTYHKSLLTEEIVLPKLTRSELEMTKTYLSSRDGGGEDWIRFGLYTKASSKLKFQRSHRKKVLLLTNVSWDAQLHYKSRIFPHMHEWVIQTINWFIDHPEMDLIIRIHPAEVTGKIISRDPIATVINDTFKTLPDNVQVIGPREKISTYALMDVADLGLIYATKAGIELAAKGIPVIVSGETWVRGHGFTNDPETIEEYFEMLRLFAAGRGSLKKDQQKALSFAYHFFFERSVKVNSVKSLRRYPYIRPNISSNWESNDLGLLKIIEEIETL